MMDMSPEDEAAITEIHERDVAEVRSLLQQAIRVAGERWLPINAIADALMTELVILRGRAPAIVSAAASDTSRRAVARGKMN